MIEVFGAPTNRAFRVYWLLEELGLPYKAHLHPPRSDAVRALNPSGKVPVVVEGDTVVSDSLAIMQWLTDRTGRMTAPAGTADRARQDAMTFAILDELDGALWTAARHSFVLPEDRRVPEVKATAKWEFETAAARIAARIKGPFVMGDEVTVPDILLTHCLGWAIVAKFGVSDPVLSDYLDRMRARPAYVRARNIAA